MPGFSVTVYFFPMLHYPPVPNAPQGLLGPGGLRRFATTLSDEVGIYALESTPQQMVHTYSIYSAWMPYVAFSPFGPWHREGPMESVLPFRLLLHRLFGGPANYEQRKHLSATMAGPILDSITMGEYKLMYAMQNYNGYVDLWLRDKTMAPGCYAHYEIGEADPRLWWRATKWTFKGFVKGEPELSVQSRM